MDVIISMIVETVIYLVSYMVDLLKRWGFLCAMLVAGLVFVTSCVFAVIPEGGVLLIFLCLLALGVVVGIALECHAHRRTKNPPRKKQE